MYESSVMYPDYQQQIQQWQSQRLANLLAPSGWLSVTGFHWLDLGDHRIGSAADNDIVFHSGPAHLGTVTLTQEGDVRIRLVADGNVTINGQSLREATLLDDADAGHSPSVVTFDSMSFHVIHRDGRKALRVRDDEAITRTLFAGLDYFTIDPAWRVVADWVPFVRPRTLNLHKRLGTVSSVEVPGKALFWMLGRLHELLPYVEKPGGDLFFVLADKTSGQETYDNARFLYTALPVDGKVVLDFNKAHNPPSAFTPYANCPMAPPENRLALRVTAGEKRYRGHHNAVTGERE
jgi:uncharacterized protein